ncbi:MAG: tRNA (adenosine(37)-N6)-threonylcarbamoyltransferase complex dimerization subunit type 1 TsaB [Clostridiales bacterium]|nr:tRNA (adenosine(37)-N6)-threonylcarbamoyltransferase complex dimerization subunit type 1 TsaB [Clostridiales bacterium]
MNVLCVDTSGDKIALALAKGDERYTFISAENSKKHNSLLLSYIDNMLIEHALKLSDIDYFGVNVGPGSFTGIRVGVATVNAFALALQKNVVEVTSLEQLFDGDDALSMLDCKHGNYYCALKRNNEISYLALNEKEITDYTEKKLELTKPLPNKLLEKTLEKIKAKQFVKQAKPFYLKKTSAERETGIDA